MEADQSSDEEDHFAPGVRVEVRNAFDGTWSSGFIVIGAKAGRYRLRRRSDAEELPETFAAGEVRRERRRSMWWV